MLNKIIFMINITVTLVCNMIILMLITMSVNFILKVHGEALITLDPVHHLKQITFLDRGDISGITMTKHSLLE